MGVSNQLRPALVFQNKHFSVFVRHISASDLMRPCSTSINKSVDMKVSAIPPIR